MYMYMYMHVYTKINCTYVDAHWRNLSHRHRRWEWSHQVGGASRTRNTRGWSTSRLWGVVSRRLLWGVRVWGHSWGWWRCQVLSLELLKCDCLTARGKRRRTPRLCVTITHMYIYTVYTQWYCIMSSTNWMSLDLQYCTCYLSDNKWTSSQF